MIHLLGYIPQLADKWMELGTALGLEHQVRALRTSSQTPDRCMLLLLSDWVNAGGKEVDGVKVEVSWPFLVSVLHNAAVDKGSVANIIKAEYIRCQEE